MNPRGGRIRWLPVVACVAGALVSCSSNSDVLGSARTVAPTTAPVATIPSPSNPATGTASTSSTPVATSGLPLPSTSAAPEPARCVAQFPCAVSPNGRYVVDGVGDPWFMVGDAGWSSLVMLDDKQIAFYFDALVARGFNTVLVNVIEAHYSDHPPFTAAGLSPFSGAMYRSAPNEAYWRWFDDYVAAAAQRHITLLATPAYLGYTSDGVANDVGAASTDDLGAFGAFLGKRYAGDPNIIWVIGGDRTAVSAPLLERMDSLARGIRSASRQLITAHTADDASAADVYGRFSWLDLNMSYDVDGTPVSDAVASYQQTPVRPTFSMEGIYEQERDAPLPLGNQLLRYQAYGAVAAGSFGHVFGNNPRWHFASRATIYPFTGTWQDSLTDEARGLASGTAHMQWFAKVWTSVNWQDLAPDLEDRFLVDGEGAGKEQAAARFDPASGVAVVYTVSRSTITLDLGALTGARAVSVDRIDPTTGGATTIATSATTSLKIPHPGTNAHGDDDWVYVLRPA